MHLLDYVRLIESDVLAPPTASTFERSMIKLVASYEHSDSWNKLIVHKSMIGSHRWKKTVEKYLAETHFEVKVKSPNPSQWT